MKVFVYYLYRDVVKIERLFYNNQTDGLKDMANPDSKYIYSYTIGSTYVEHVDHSVKVTLGRLR